MNIYQIDFDYTFALADIRASVDGADSMEFSQERPELIDKFKYDWVTTDSELIPDFVVIMSELLGCKTRLKSKVEELSLSFKFHDLKVGNMDYAAFINIPTLQNCINLKKSKVVKFSNGDIMEISNPVFLPGNYPILFKVKDMPSAFFCNQEFKDYVKANSYTGLRFKECVIKSKSWF